MTSATRIIEVVVPPSMSWPEAARFAQHEALRRVVGATRLWLHEMASVPDPEMPGAFRLAAKVAVIEA